MVRLGLVFGFAAVLASSAFAALNLDLDENYKSTLLPNSGSINITFSGKVDVLLPGFDVASGFVEHPGLTGTGAFLFADFTPAFLAYANASNPGVDYVGDIFFVTVSSTDAPGDYFFNNGLPTGLADVSLTATNGTINFTDAEAFGITVNAVPEPATMAVLGLGAAALLRRRNRK